MSLNHTRFVQVIAAAFLVAIFAAPQLMAQSHVVSSADLQKEVLSSTQTRQQNIDTLTNALSGSKAEKGLKAAQVDPSQVKTAISSLSDAELAQLAARASNAQKDFAAGTISDRDLLIILVGVAVLILIIVAVH